MTPPALQWAEAHIATTRAVLDCLGSCVRLGRDEPTPRSTSHQYAHCTASPYGGPILVWFRCEVCGTLRQYGTISPSVRWNQCRASRKRFANPRVWQD